MQMQQQNDNRYLPNRDNTMRRHAPNWTGLRLPIFVPAIVWTFSVRVVDPIPVPQRPANKLEKPSRPIPRLRTPGVGGPDAAKSEEVWYVPTYKVKTNEPQQQSTMIIYIISILT